MTWTAIALTKTNNTPVHFHLDGPHSSSQAFDQAVCENSDLFIVCLVPGSHPVNFHYESILSSKSSGDLCHVPFKRDIFCLDGESDEEL